VTVQNQMCGNGAILVWKAQ